ncbi:unnamed protein product [Prunus armeniaca]
MHDFRVEAHGSIIDVSLAAYFIMPASEIDGEGIRADLEVEVETGMIDGEMDAISSCSLFSKFLFANARYGVF